MGVVLDDNILYYVLGYLLTILFWYDAERQCQQVGYGEVIYHVRDGNKLKSTTLFKDKNYDFRDVSVNTDNKTIYAVSHTGHLFIKTTKDSKILPLPNIQHPFAVEPMQDKRYLLVVGEKSLAKVDMVTNTIVGSQVLNFNVTLCSRYDYAPVIFDDNGRMHTSLQSSARRFTLAQAHT